MLVTKRQLSHIVWGDLKESDSLQAFQQAIKTSIPSPSDTVTQYHTHLTSAICKNNTVWHHTIQSSCQDPKLPHPLFNPITYIQYKPQLSLHNPYHEQPCILLFRLP
jgi:hypothetical protein